MATNNSNTIRQWASVVDAFSSQYNSTGWSANQITGAPKVYPNYGDKQGAWASKSFGVQFVEIGFQEKVIPSSINIYETYHAGGVKTIKAKNPQNDWVILYQTQRVEKIKSSRIFSPPLKNNSFETNKIRIEMDCSVAQTWVELDAVELVGSKQGTASLKTASSNLKTIHQWASVVDAFSSEYDSSGWSANQILGCPKVYPEYGDLQGAWASGDFGIQFVEIGFQEKVIPSSINIYETYHAGGVTKIHARNPQNNWVILYEAPNLEIIQMSRIFSPVLKNNNFETNKIRIEIDCSAAQSWVELDAVELVGSRQGTDASSLIQNQRRGPQVTSLWVAEITNFSTQYNTSGWSANMVVGEPRVYPTYGDVPGAWATQTKDAHQFIEVKFEEKLYLNEINIYETYHAGGVKRVSAKDLAGNWVMLYETNHCQNLESSRIFSPWFSPPKFPVDELRVEIDCTASHSWVELDAINIKGTTMPELSSLASCFSKLVNNKMFSDVEIIVDGLSFYGHKAIMAQRSSFFKSIFLDGHIPSTAKQEKGMYPPLPEPVMPTAPPLDDDAPPSYDSLFGLPPPNDFSSALPTSEQLYGVKNSVGFRNLPPVQPRETKLPAHFSGDSLVLNNVTPDVFGVILHFLYTEELPDIIYVAKLPVEINVMCIIRTAQAAEKFDLPGLKALCERRILTVNSLPLHDVLEAFLESYKQPGLESINKMAWHFMLSNSDRIKDQPRFKALPKEIQTRLTTSRPSYSDQSSGQTSSSKKSFPSSDVCSLQ
ncbi:uncharacterized protein LOC133190296 [Saccostrea echinata]|uniref:uncharacterized protein LOC133190296 n=1 Tax=Saccostrea echinata TaxID=191078 RepID=UPI002A815635|nr:uncharacterized protein LOC133190296 [Saccostrea echinata]